MWRVFRLNGYAGQSTVCNGFYLIGGRVGVEVKVKVDVLDAMSADTDTDTECVSVCLER